MKKIDNTNNRKNIIKYHKNNFTSSHYHVKSFQQQRHNLVEHFVVAIVPLAELTVLDIDIAEAVEDIANLFDIEVEKVLVVEYQDYLLDLQLHSLSACEGNAM